jgi:hypothetical protein
MADVQPLKALHYNLEKTGDLQSVVSPPYDVIDAEMRRRLESQSPYNVVRVDIPVTEDGSDVYAHAAKLLEGWQADGAVVQDSEPAIWPLEQDYSGPDGRSRTRRGFLARVRVEEYGPGPHPPARAHPSRPQGGPPAPDASDAGQPLADLLALLRPAAAAWARARVSHAARAAVGQTVDGDGTVNRLWRVGDAEAIERSGGSPTPSC